MLLRSLRPNAPGALHMTASNNPPNGTNPDQSPEGRFRAKIIPAKHDLVDPCFMTGKGCVYAQIIEEERQQRATKGEAAGFFIVPFRENFGVFHKNCLQPFLKENYEKSGKVSLNTAEIARRPGVVICEGVCKRIQEAHFVVCDVSMPNPNVFYELGLAHGLGHKIVLIHQKGSLFGNTIGQYLGCTPYPYKDLDPLDVGGFDLENKMWTRPSVQHQESTELIDDGGKSAGTVLYELALLTENVKDDKGQLFTVLQARDPKESEESTPQRLDSLDQLLRRSMELVRMQSHAESVRSHEGDIRLDFRTHLKSAFGLAVPRILGSTEEGLDAGSLGKISPYWDDIQKIGAVRSVKPTDAFNDVRGFIERAYCTVVRTGFRDCHPMAYFWLGYAHARGKNVIPITVINHSWDAIDDLAFDIRAQRHMTFVRHAPQKLEGELRQTLKHLIAADFAIWSRKRFWDEILGRRGEVSIFTGTLRYDAYRREVVGDWDLRSASELTSYLTQHEYRATIASPIYAPAGKSGDAGVDVDKAYVLQLGKLLHGRNCIIVASPEVNAFTEIVLGCHYGLNPEELFRGGLQISERNRAIVAVKETLRIGDTKRALYKEEVVDEAVAKGRKLQRGFLSSRITGHRVMKEFVNQMDPLSPFRVCAHLAIVPNLFTKDGEYKPDRYADLPRRHIIVLNGLSGPATFALTHVLTGGVSKEFVNYEAQFDPTKKSEEAVADILKALEALRKSNKLPVVERIFDVSVVKDKEPPATPATKDWRQIASWVIDNTLDVQ
jgi:hypothetical protein